MYPRIIHQTWKNTQVPGTLMPFQASWRRLNPDWEYRLWTDADIAKLVREHFPALLPLYHRLPRGIHRADFARYLFLWKYGGLYVDLDMEALRGAEALAIDAECQLGCEPHIHAEQLRGRSEAISNAAMTSEPGHLFWEKVIDEVGHRIESGCDDPVWLTGPLCVQSAYEQYGEALGVSIFDPEVFFPLPDLDSPTLELSDSERRGYQRMLVTRSYPAASVAVHHWSHTWISTQALRRAIGTVQRALGGMRAVVTGQVTGDEILRPERYGVRFPEEIFVPRAARRAAYDVRVQAGRWAARRTTLSIGVLLYNRADLVHLLRARLESLATVFGAVRVYIVGEDSSDGTEEVLRQWRKQSPELFTSLPADRADESRGIARIAQLRNQLLKAMEADPVPDFIAMIDGDLEGPISLDGLLHSVGELTRLPSLDGICAFGVNNWFGLDQTVPFFGYTYYDPMAFREDTWERTSSDRKVRLRLGRLRPGDRLLPVRSGFAGLAIYRASSIRGLRYPTDGQDCEHVGFHRALALRGGHLVLNPALLVLAGRQGHHQQSRSCGLQAHRGERDAAGRSRGSTLFA